MHRPYRARPRRRSPFPRSRAAAGLALACRLTLAVLGGASWPAAQAQPARVQYDISAGPLAQVLSRYAAQSGVALSLVAGQVAGQQSAGLHGRYEVDEGFAQLLRDTGLAARRGVSGYVLVAVPGEAAGSVVLPPVEVDADALPEKAVYTAPRSSAYLSSQDLDRFGRVSVGDLLAGIPGVQVGDSRNGGALDVNIRGIQGQSRVAVRVDGSEQALDVYRGYAGTQQRSYIDPDLLSSVTINKGPSMTSGAIGGSVEMRTIGVQDILVDGRHVGLRLTGDVWNNGVAAPHRTGKWNEDLRTLPHDDRGSLFGSDAKAGSAAFAYANAHLDVVAAYARRKQGNYSAGDKGRDRYRIYTRGREVSTVATIYNPGDEVLNSSAETESMLLKATIRPAAGHTLELGYRRYDGKIGEIMPSDIFRFGTAGIKQYPLGRTEIDTYTARYQFQPADQPLVAVTANLWMTDAKTSQLNSVEVPVSQAYKDDRGWTRMADRRIGGDLGNTSRWRTGYGGFKLDLGGAFQVEDIRPQRGVVTTANDINMHRTLRDASRKEFSLNGKLEYQPVERLTFWGCGRYSHFSSVDNNVLATAHRERLRLRQMVLNRPGGPRGIMYWFPDADGQFTDATDPRLRNGFVFWDSNNPFEGMSYDSYGPTTSNVYPTQVIPVVTGFDYAPKLRSSGGGFAPSAGLNLELAPETFVYASYTQGLRMPSLFETSIGTLQTRGGKDLKPERSVNWEVGASTSRGNVLVDGDSAALKVAYFNNKIKNYITRYYDPTPQKRGIMAFSNTDSYQTRGLELQSHYDAGRVFADLSATYYLMTETCDAAFAQVLRKNYRPRYRETKNTPNCTPGSFMGSYTNTQNPPKLALNLTAGLRFFNETLTLGGRMTYTSGPTAKADKPWQTGVTVPQVVYHQVTLFDLFLNYQLREHTVVNVSAQNLTNRYYLDPLAQSFMPAPGRTVRIGMQTRF